MSSAFLASCWSGSEQLLISCDPRIPDAVQDSLTVSGGSPVSSDWVQFAAALKKFNDKWGRCLSGDGSAVTNSSAAPTSATPPRGGGAAANARLLCRPSFGDDEDKPTDIHQDFEFPESHIQDKDALTEPFGAKSIVNGNACRTLQIVSVSISDCCFRMIQCPHMDNE